MPEESKSPAAPAPPSPHASPAPAPAPSAATTPSPSAAATPQHAPAAPRPSYGPVAFWCVVVTLVLVSGYLFHNWFEDRLTRSVGDDAFVESHIVNVAPQSVSGRIVRFLVEENDQVTQGQVLAEIEPTNYRDQVDQAQSKLTQAEADLETQQASLETLKKQVPLQIEAVNQTLAAARTDVEKSSHALVLTTDDVDKSIDEAKASVQTAQAELVLARQVHGRLTTLVADRVASKQELDEATRSNDAAMAGVHLADAGLAKAESARTRITVAKDDLRSAQTAVAKAQSALDLARTGYDQIREVELTVNVKKEVVKEAQVALAASQHQLAFTKVRAPFAGIVVKRYSSLGDTVSAGTPILSMYDPDLLYVTANLEETRLRGVAPGNEVDLDIDAFADPFKGRVLWLNKSTGAEFALMPRNVVAGEFTKVVQRVPVRIWIEKDDRWPQLRAGLSARVSIQHGKGDPAWAAETAMGMARIETQFNLPAE